MMRTRHVKRDALMIASAHAQYPKLDIGMEMLARRKGPASIDDLRAYPLAPGPFELLKRFQERMPMFSTAQVNSARKCKRKRVSEARLNGQQRANCIGFLSVRLNAREARAPSNRCHRFHSHVARMNSDSRSGCTAALTAPAL